MSRNECLTLLERGDILKRREVEIMPIIEVFPEAVRPWLVGCLQHIQFYDGCSVGCPFCGLDVKRKITEGFGRDGWREFAARYISFMPDNISFYWASEPLEIGGFDHAGMPYDYVDICEDALPYLRSGQYISTTTSLPAGSEEVAERLFQLSGREWWKLITRFGGSQHFHIIRVSESKKNKERVAKLVERLNGMGLSKNFLDAQLAFWEDRSLEKVKRVGNFIRHPDGRKITHGDFDTIACYDGTLLRPDGLFSIFFEACTKENPFGYRLVKLRGDARNLEVPAYVCINDYEVEGVVKRVLGGSLDILIPEIMFQNIDSKSGKLVSERTLLTTRRLGLQLEYFWGALLGLKKEQVEGNESARLALKHAYAELARKMELFEGGLYKDMEDREAVWLISKVWPEIILRLLALGVLSV